MAISVLTSLQNLRLSGSDCKLRPGFQKLKNLRNLDFHYRCSINTLGDLYFENIQSNREVSISLKGCPITRLSENSLIMEANVTELDLSDTHLTLKQILNAKKLFQHFNCPNVFLHSLKRIPNFELCQVFEVFVNTNIIALDVSDNLIVYYSWHRRFSLPPKLERLYLHRNRIDYKALLHELSNNVNTLKYLDLSDQFLDRPSVLKR